ncbi:MAG: flagellar hook-length control protein FliK [Phycisphaerales bacterium]|nr:flagellar hook-length control protein FliK [Hyphomonadaceae bacterium]
MSGPAPVLGPTAAPVMLQLIDLAGGAAAEAPQTPAPAMEAPPIAPSVPPDHSAEQAPADSADTESADVNGDAAKVAANAGDAPAEAPSRPLVAQQQSAPPQPLNIMPAQPVAPPPQTATNEQTRTDAEPSAEQTTPPPVLATVAQAQPVRARTMQSGKTDVAVDNAKSDATDAKAIERSAAQKPQGHAPPAVQNKGDATPFVLADAPETLAQAAQPLTLSPTSANPAQNSHAVSDQSAARAMPAATQVAREIVRRFDGGNTRFELRLDPPELGRIEVRLEVSRDHRVSAVVSADSPQALSELVRHARELEQTLQSAGLQLNENGLSFDLRQSPDDTTNETQSSGSGAGEASAEEAPAQTPVTARPIGLERWRGVRVDVMV